MSILKSFKWIVFGVGLEYLVLWFIEQQVDVYPRIPDVLMDRLPLVNFGWAGELFYLLLLATAVWLLWRYQRQQLPEIIQAIGVYYAVRAIFLLLLPIGSPLGALLPEERLNIWQFASHAYFPGGHVGVLTILTLSIERRAWRKWMWLGVILFAWGTLLNKNHYTADSVAGVMLGWGVWTWLAVHHRRHSDRAHALTPPA